MHAFWRGRSVRAQLLIGFLFIDVVVALVAGSAALARARALIRVEMAASVRIAAFAVEEAQDLAGQQPPGRILTALSARLRALPHVRVAVKDASGAALAAAAPAAGAAARGAHTPPPAPAWFAALVAPPVEKWEVPVAVDGRSIGRVEIRGEPAERIAVFWENAIVLGGLGILLNAAMIGLLYLLFGRVLDPLTTLAAGLCGLGRRTGARPPRPPARELAVISEHFDASAQALAAARAENLRLSRRLISAQDDERRRTARELHDEVGSCLFGLKASASSIANVAADLPDKARRTVAERLQDIRAIIEHLQAINRSMLDRLRPTALGHLPLRELLGELVRECSRQHAQMSFAFSAGELKRSYGDPIDLTIYRCIQESLTNVVRHAQANHVSVELAEAASALELTVRDDGCGLDAARPAGFGIHAMRERVEGLGGRCQIDSAPGGGTSVRVVLPLPRAADGGNECAGHERATA